VHSKTYIIKIDPLACDHSLQNTMMNQYWYSPATIAVFVAEVEEQASHTSGNIAFLSTPSIYFSISPAVRKRSRLLDFDLKWSKDPGYIMYDFNHPGALPEELRSQSSMVVLDPPFITEEVWGMYSRAVRWLLKTTKDGEEERTGLEGRILCTTVSENADRLNRLLGVKKRHFQPSIPSLTYQFSTFSNYESPRLDQVNPELL